MLRHTHKAYLSSFNTWQNIFMPWSLVVGHSIPNLCAILFKMTLLVAKEALVAKICNQSSHKTPMTCNQRFFIFKAQTNCFHALITGKTYQKMMVCRTAVCTRASFVHIIPGLVPVITLICRSIVNLTVSVTN